MSLVTIARYRAITGDATTSGSDVSARIEEAVDLLEDELDRPLTEAERTETMYPTRDGSLWPHAIPLVTCADYTIDGYRLYGSSAPFPATDVLGDPTGVSVIYTGGWVERSANPTADNRLPVFIERDLAWAAYALGQTEPGRQALAVPPGASSVSLGDVSVSFANGRTASAPGEANIVWSPKTLRYRYQRIGGYE